MAKIEKTRIATSIPLNLCKGLPIWPSLGAIGIGASSAGRSGPLLDTSTQVMWYKFGVGFSYDFFMGICGPAFAVGMDLDGEADGGTLSLNVSEDEVQAGMVAAFTFSATTDLFLEEYDIFQGWKNDFNLHAGIEVDILGLFINAIIWALQNGGGAGDAEMKPFPGYKYYFGMSGSDSGTLGHLPNAVAEPKMHMPFNIVPQVAPLEAINVTLHALLGELAMGPTLWFGIPVSVGVKSIDIDGVSYTNIKPSGGGRLTGSATGSAPASPKHMKVTLSHTAGFDFGVGFYVEVSVLKLFSFNGNLDMSLLDLMGIKVSSGSFDNTLENDIGNVTLAESCACGLETANIKVILDPVGS